MSSNTTNIKLYKADPVADGNSTFNIKTMLNDNWDKIDTAINSNSNKIGDLSSDYTKIISSVDDTGSANTYVIAPTPAITTYTKYQTFKFKATNANTGASTLNVNGLGAKALVKDVNVALVAGDILAGQVITAIYDGTNFQIIPNYKSLFTSKANKIAITSLWNGSTTSGNLTLASSCLNFNALLVRIDNAGVSSNAIRINSNTYPNNFAIADLMGLSYQNGNVIIKIVDATTIQIVTNANNGYLIYIKGITEE